MAVLAVLLVLPVATRSSLALAQAPATGEKPRSGGNEAEDKYGDFNKAEVAIGSGPFVLERYERGVTLVFKRNPDFYVQGLPYFDGVEWQVTPDATARLSLLRTGKVEFLHVHDWLYGAFYPGQPNNRSHVNDPELNPLLTAQRQELDAEKRQRIVLDIQRTWRTRRTICMFPSG
jgi:ABC-type transport system substrate-binding protein